jgi:hypothetical protein
MPRADIHDERIRAARDARQRLSQARINRLPNQMFDDSAMRCSFSNYHKFARI